MIIFGFALFSLHQCYKFMSAFPLEKTDEICIFFNSLFNKEFCAIGRHVHSNSFFAITPDCIHLRHSYFVSDSRCNTNYDCQFVINCVFYKKYKYPNYCLCCFLNFFYYFSIKNNKSLEGRHLVFLLLPKVQCSSI